MPPQDSRLDDIAPTAVLPLQDWLKLLSGRGVDMRVAMSLAAKMWVGVLSMPARGADSRYNSHNTKERLETLNAQKLKTVVPDKEARRSVVNAVKGISTGPVSYLAFEQSTRLAALTSRPSRRSAEEIRT